MTTSWTPQGDFAQVAQEVETIVYEDPQGNPTTITAALPVEQQDEAQDGTRWGLLLVRRSWLVPAEQLPQAPRPGGRIFRGSQSWTIYRVREQHPAGTYRLDARGWQLSPADQHTVELLLPQWSQDTLGGAVRSWSTTASGLQAQIQLDETRYASLPRLVRQIAHYRILIETSQEVQPGQRIKDDLNRIFDVIEAKGLDAEGDFQLVQCLLRN